MRVAIVDWYYPAVLDRLYGREVRLSNAPYQTQLEAVMGQCFGTTDAYSVHLKELGHEAFDIVMNCVPLQRQWAMEHGAARVLRHLPVPRRGRPRTAASFLLGRRVLLEQLRLLDPDVVFMHKLNGLLREDLRRLRRQGRLVVGHLGSTPPWRMIPEYDMLVSNMPHMARRVRNGGVEAHYWPHAFDHRMADRVGAEGLDTSAAAETRDIPIAFVGTVHPSRIAPSAIGQLERLCQEVDLRIWGTLSSDVSPRSALRANYEGEAWGLDMYRVMARTRITVNRHGAINRPYACNCRMFESTGMGALLLTESARNLPPLFEPDRELVSYENADDLADKARHYLENDDERRNIAETGRIRTLKNHTYLRRMEELVELLCLHLGT